MNIEKLKEIEVPRIVTYDGHINVQLANTVSALCQAVNEMKNALIDKPKEPEKTIDVGEGYERITEDEYVIKDEDWYQDADNKRFLRFINSVGRKYGDVKNKFPIARRKKTVTFPDPGEGWRIVDKDKDKPNKWAEYWGGSLQWWRERDNPDSPFLFSHIYRTPVPIPGDVWGVPGGPETYVWIQIDTYGNKIMRALNVYYPLDIREISFMPSDYILIWREGLC